jgi:Protein of unknown function (DUF2934)
MHPEHRSIGELAYRLWQARGCPEGSAERDWLDAEEQLTGAQRTIEPRTIEPRTVEPHTVEPRTVEARTIEPRTVEPRATEPRAAQPRATESATSNAIDSSLKATFPASDPPASQRADEPPANADAKWKAAASRKGPAAARPRQSKSTQGKPGAKPPG